MGGCENPALTFNEKIQYINENGLYSLILKSQKQEAKQFKHWVTREVLPTIRKTGTYAIIPPVPQILIQNETDLHYKVVQYIRKYFDNPIIVPGLGELQINTRQRDDAYNKGYKGGQPDILILNYHKKYRGLAIELKTPTNKGILSDKQKHYLEVLKDHGYYTIVSND